MASIDEDLTQLDDYVRKLKVEYDIYFGGGAKKPPAEMEWKVRNFIRKYSDGSNMTSSQRFRFTAIQQRYALFAALWMQKLKIKEEGYRRPQDAILGIQGLRAEEQHAAEAALKQHDLPRGEAGAGAFSVDFADADLEPHQVQALFEALTAARKNAGDNTSGSLASFKKFVRQKTAQIRKEYDCAKVEYSVELKDGQVKLKARPKT